jgi:DNA topoisomerase-3
LACRTLRSKAWNDAKVTAHHAVVPTGASRRELASLTGPERAVYELVCRRYLAQFYPPHTYLETAIEIDVAGDRFEAKGRQTTQLGWKALYADPQSEAVAGEAEADKDPEPGSAAPLPRLAPGEPVTVGNAAITPKRTSPPKPFTDASLIAAMCGVAKFVQSPDAKKILTEADGIGTPATRAAIIETLFERGYVERAGRAIVSTETGRALVGALPEVATTPDMTAVWEAAMRAVQGGSQTLDTFVARVGQQLQKLVRDGRALGRIAVPAARAPTPRAQPPSRPHSPRRPNPHRRRKAAS